MTIDRSWLDGVWHGWGYSSFHWPIRLTVDSTNNSYLVDYVGLGGKSRLERLSESDQEIFFREHLIEGDGFTDQDLFIITKINQDRLQFQAFNDADDQLSSFIDTNDLITTGFMTKEINQR